MDRKTIQKQHEKAVCESLLNALNLRADFLREGNDKDEPDMLYMLDAGVILGIEVGTAYYSDNDAKQEWTLVAGERTFPLVGYEMREKGVMRNPDDLICQRIQKIISDKCKNEYTGANNIWLCVQQRAALSDFNSMARCFEDLFIPKEHFFQSIYLIDHSSNAVNKLNV
jgi:hypothetical protein